MNGWALLALLASVAAWTFWRSLRRNSSLLLGLSLVTACGCLLLIECAAITTTFYPAYHSLLLLSTFIAVTLPGQMLIDFVFAKRA